MGSLTLGHLAQVIKGRYVILPEHAIKVRNGQIGSGRQTVKNRNCHGMVNNSEPCRLQCPGVVSYSGQYQSICALKVIGIYCHNSVIISI